MLSLSRVLGKMIADQNSTLVMLKLMQSIDLDNCLGVAQEFALVTLLLNFDFRSKWS